jgi:ferredoxin
MPPIKGAPTAGSYNPNDAVYWDRSGLRGEIERVFDICNGCRLCFNLCPSFPELFRAVEAHDGDARQVSEAETGRVADLCFQCKICYVKCPYTPDDGHEFKLDFPRLMLRANAVRKKQSGLTVRDRVLSRPNLLGRAAGMCAGLANWSNRQLLLRIGLEAALGIHRQKLLPEFHGETFEEWFRKQPAPAGDPSRAVLFYTCSVNYNAGGRGRRRSVFEERHFALLSEAGLLRHAGARTRRYRTGEAAGARERRVAPSARARRQAHRRHRPHVLLHAAQGISRTGGDARSA